MTAWSKRALVCAVLVGFMSGSVALADDLFPPNSPPVAFPGVTSWQRGAPLSTSQEWDFLQGINPAAPDGATVPLLVGNGLGGTSGPVATMNGLVWVAGQWANMENVPGSIVFRVPNWIDKEPVKWLNLQVSYFHPGDESQATPNVVLDAWKDGQPALTQPIAGVNGNLIPSSGMHYMWQQWHIRPNPDWEQITLQVPPGYAVDQVVIDTVSIPEPGSLLAGLGILAGLALKRVRR